MSQKLLMFTYFDGQLMSTVEIILMSVQNNLWPSRISCQSAKHVEQNQQFFHIKPQHWNQYFVCEINRNIFSAWPIQNMWRMLHHQLHVEMFFLSLTFAISRSTHGGTASPQLCNLSSMVIFQFFMKLTFSFLPCLRNKLPADCMLMTTWWFCQHHHKVFCTVSWVLIDNP